MDPVLLSNALKIIANKIDYDQYPSRFKIANQLEFLVAGLFPESSTPKYNAEGDLIKVIPPKLPNAPKVEHGLKEITETREKRERERERQKYAPEVTEKNHPKSYDQNTVDKLIKENVLYYEVKTKCPYCGWSTDEETMECPICEEQVKNGRDPHFNATYNPARHVVKVSKILKIYDVDSFVDYLKYNDKDTYSQKELEIISGTTNIPDSKLKTQLLDLGYSLKSLSSKDTDFEYSSLERFITHIKDNDKDYCTEQQLNKLLNSLSTNGLPGLNKTTKDIVADPNKAEQKLFLETYLVENGITIGELKPTFKPMDDKSEKISPKQKALGKKYLELSKILKDKHGEDVPAEKVKLFVQVNFLTNVVGVGPVVEAWLNAQYEEVARDFSISKREILKMIAQEMIPDEYEYGGLYEAVEEALTRPESSRFIRLS